MNKKSMKKLLPFCAGFCLILITTLWLQINAKDNVQEIKQELSSIEEPKEKAVLPVEVAYPHKLERGSSLAMALGQLNIGGLEVHNLVEAAADIKDLGRLKAGTRFRVDMSQNDGSFVALHIRMSPLETLAIEKTSIGAWHASTITKEVQKKIVTFKGVVTSSLWESAVEADMNPSLISDLSEIFAWQVDFAREVRAGDRWRLSVEETYVQGNKVGWGSILSAEYSSGDQTHTAVLFRKDGKDIGYFAPDGSSLKRIFLKSPIHFARISSRYNRRRLHPVLKTVRPHNGVDYAAKTGTPVRSVGDGVVWAKGYNRGAGNYIKVRHNSTYMTAYKHLSRFPRGIKKGSKIDQGQTIGYVGSTGLSTGPHLHFEFYQNGRYVDPLGIKFPTADPVSEQDLTLFTTGLEAYLAYLPDWDRQDNNHSLIQ